MTDVNFGLDLRVVMEHQRLGSGRTVRVYRCPYPSEGPVRLRAGDQHCLVYMYAHFVFRWPAGCCRVHIGHGTIESSMPLWWDHPIEGIWSPQSLVEFGQTWTRRHLASFRPPTKGGDRA